MNKEIKDEIVEYLMDGGTVNLEIGEYSYEISPAENWVGGDGMEGFISEVLGNVVYDNARYVLVKTIEFLEKNVGNVENVDFS